jgi:hypothetical protein
MKINETVAPRGVTDPDDFPSLPEFLNRVPAIPEHAPSIAHCSVDTAAGDDARPWAAVDGEHEDSQFHPGETASPTFTDLAITADPEHDESLPPLAHYHVDAAAGDNARLSEAVEGDTEVGEFHVGETASPTFTTLAISADPGHAEGSPSLAHYNVDAAAGEGARLSAAIDGEPGVSLFYLSEPAPALADLIISADPVREAAAIAADLDRGRESMVIACERLFQAWRMYEDDLGTRDRFIEELVRNSVVGRSDLRHGVDKSFIAKMKRVGECAPYLRRPDILPRLSEGISVLYAAAVLLKAMEGAPEDRANEMAALLATVSGGITRDFLERETKKRKPLPEPKPAPVIESAARLAEPAAEAERPFDLVLITPGKEDWERLRQDYAGLDAISRLLGTINVNGIEAVMIFAPLREMASTTRLLSWCGINHISHVLLTSSPPVPEVTDATVIITAEKRSGEMIVVPDDWEPFYPHPVHARVIAMQLAPNARANLHVFAPAEAGSSENWIAISHQHDGGDRE